MCKFTMPSKPSLYYYTVLSVLQPLLPLCIIAVVQYLAYRELQRSIQQFGENNHRIRIIKQTSLTFIVVVVVFFILCVPISLFGLSFWFIEIQTPIPKKYQILFLLETCNSSANPLIYGRVERPILQVYRSMKHLFYRIWRQLTINLSSHHAQTVNIPMQSQENSSSNNHNTNNDSSNI